jgi:membrane-associated PAP2 superfamily phosphatase
MHSRLLSGCGDAGLDAYRDLQVADLFYPAAVAAFLTVAMVLLVRGVTPRLSWLAALAVVLLVRIMRLRRGLRTPAAPSRRS